MIDAAKNGDLDKVSVSSIYNQIDNNVRSDWLTAMFDEAIYNGGKYNRCFLILLLEIM